MLPQCTTNLVFAAIVTADDASDRFQGSLAIATERSLSVHTPHSVITTYLLGPRSGWFGE